MPATRTSYNPTRPSMSCTRRLLITSFQATNSWSRNSLGLSGTGLRRRSLRFRCLVDPNLARREPCLNLNGSSARAAHNKSLDASGGSVFRNFLGTAEGALIRAAASTQPLGVGARAERGLKWIRILFLQ